MADIAKNRDDLILSFPTNNAGQITAQDMRNFVMSVLTGLDDRANVGSETAGVLVDGGSNVLVAGSYGYRRVDHAGVIQRWTILTDASGSVAFDVKKCALGSFPTTTSITSGGTPPSVSAARYATGTCTDWTAVSAGDILEFVITGTPATVKKAWLFLDILH